MSRLIKALALIVTALVMTPGPAAAQFLTVNVAYFGRENDPPEWTASRFKALVEAAMPGKIVARVRSANEITDPARLSAAVVQGDVDVALIPVPFMSAYSTRFQAYELPYVFDNRDDLAAHQDGPKGLALLKGLEPKGVVGLGYLRAGTRQTAAVQFLLQPKDAEGLRFLFRDFPLARAVVNATKGKTLLASSNDSVSDLIASGGVEVVRGTWFELEETGAAEGLGYVTRSNDVFETHVMIAGASFWHDLSRPMRTAVEAAAAQAIKDGDLFSKQRNADSEARLIDKGVKVADLSPADREAWRALYAGIAKSFNIQK